MWKVITRDKKFCTGFCLALIVAMILPVFIKKPFVMHILILVCIWMLLGMGWNIIGGYAGQISNGHALFYGIGAYTCGIGMYLFKISPWIMMWAGMVISALTAIILGGPLLRLKGHYFAVATMAAAECGRIIFLNLDFVGGATGIDFLNKDLPAWYTMQFTEKEPYYYIFLCFVVIVFLLTKVMDGSKLGYYLRAIKSNEDSAQSVGINTTKYKMLAYIFSAVIVSLAGSLYANYIQYIDPYILMPLNISLMICLVAVMGGIGTVVGPVVGAFVMTVISEWTRSTFASINGFDLFIYGVLVIVIVTYMPGGIVSIFNKKKAGCEKV